jgi:hypothetical protein
MNFHEWDAAVAHKSQMSGLDAFRMTQKQYKKEKDQDIF